MDSPPPSGNAGSQPLFAGIDARLERDREQSDVAFFQTLSHKLEYVTKIVTAGIVACVGDSADRHRYALEHRLVRADSIGKWVKTLDDALVGPATDFLIPEARFLTRELTEKVGEHDWRYTAVDSLRQAATEVGSKTVIGKKISLRQYFDIGVQLRNRSRGHGATTTPQCSKSCLELSRALDLVVENISLFKLSWVHLRRNLSGKYNVSALANDSHPFQYYKRTNAAQLANGVYFDIPGRVDSRGHRHVPLIYTDTKLSDIFLPNGNFRKDHFDTLSYITNEVRQETGHSWSTPPARLPPSETEGRSALEEFGNTFSNAPIKSSEYVPRQALEARLYEELIQSDRHPIVSLIGPGGIGKTTIALITITKIAELKNGPYDVIFWISSRDIDLLNSGPKQVLQRVFTKRDVTRYAVDLLKPDDATKDSFDPDEYFQLCLTKGAAGPTLFVFDNFETIQYPSDVFSWIDTYIRPPNKVLITSRISRDFKAAFPIEIGGMLEDEATRLIHQHASYLGIRDTLPSKYVKELIHESEGHPYVIKILLGQAAKEGHPVTPRRIVANSDDLLRNLFERTFTALSPAGQRVFLLLCSWRSFVPSIAVEAVLYRPSNERFNVGSALEELQQFSLINRIESELDKESFVGVPLAASIYGRKKLETSPFRIEIESDRQLLKEFSVVRRGDIQRGIYPKIERVIESFSVDNRFLENLPILEYLAYRVPKTYLMLSKLIQSIDQSENGIAKAKQYIRSFLETADIPSRVEAWNRLEELCRQSGDLVGEIHAICEASLVPTVTPRELGRFANQLNGRLREVKVAGDADVSNDVLRPNLRNVADHIHQYIDKISAKDCSALAWLYLNAGCRERAYDVAMIGLERDPKNNHCQRLVEKLDS